MTHTHGGTDAPECTTCTEDHLADLNEAETLLYTMVSVANGVGHALPWALALKLWPHRENNSLRNAAAVLQMSEYIIATKDGFKVLG